MLPASPYTSAMPLIQYGTAQRTRQETIWVTNKLKECMNVNTLITEQERIYDRIRREYPSNENIEPILDGVADPEAYLALSPRIMWILKEPYDYHDEHGNPIGGGWSFTQHLFIEKLDSTSRGRAFQPICYINYGIRKGIQDWDKMPWLRDSEEMRMGLRKIAYINVNKLPALKCSSGVRIEEAYRKHRDLILDQIKTYSPNILFACDPHANLILKDIGFAEPQWKKFGSAASVQISSACRLVWVWHPSQRSTVKRVDYVNDAIKAATAELSMME